MDVPKGLLSCVFWVRNFWHKGSWEQLMAWWATSLFTSFQVTTVKGLDFLDRDNDPGASWLSPVLTLIGQSCLSKWPMFFFLIWLEAKKNLIRVQQCTEQRSLSLLSHTVAVSLLWQEMLVWWEGMDEDQLLSLSPWRGSSMFPLNTPISKCCP